MAGTPSKLRAEMEKIIMYEFSKKYLKKEAKRNSSTAFGYTASDVWVNGKSVKLAKNCNAFHGDGAIVAAAAFLKDGSPVIMTDEIYEAAPDYAKAFFAMHELGHIEYGHISPDPKVAILQALGRMVPGSSQWKRERAADNYAAKCVGFSEAINAMSWVGTHVQIGFLSRVEMFTRMIRLLIDKQEVCQSTKDEWKKLNGTPLFGETCSAIRRMFG